MTTLLLKGIAVGFAVAAPVGPIGLLILKRSVVESRMSGFVSGLGAATADVIGAAIATFGIQTILDLVDAHEFGLHVFAGAFLVIFGLLTLRSRPPDHEAKRPVHERNMWVAYGTTTALTLANPMTILSLVVICATAGLGEATRSEGTAFVLGVGIGSTAWWAFLSTAAAWLGTQISRRAFRWINGCAGGALIAFGAYEIVQAL